MEDAMVINRGSLQRGFAHGQIYKPEVIDLKDVEKSASQVSRFLFFDFSYSLRHILLCHCRPATFSAIHQNLDWTNISMRTDCRIQVFT